MTYTDTQILDFIEANYDLRNADGKTLRQTVSLQMDLMRPPAGPTCKHGVLAGHCADCPSPEEIESNEREQPADCITGPLGSTRPSFTPEIAALLTARRDECLIALGYSGTWDAYPIATGTDNDE